VTTVNCALEEHLLTYFTYILGGSVGAGAVVMYAADNVLFRTPGFGCRCVLQNITARLSQVIFFFWNNTLVVVVVYADNTTTIIVSSAVGSVTLIALVCLFQFIRYDPIIMSIFYILSCEAINSYRTVHLRGNDDIDHRRYQPHHIGHKACHVFVYA